VGNVWRKRDDISSGWSIHSAMMDMGTDMSRQRMKVCSGCRTDIPTEDEDEDEDEDECDREYPDLPV